MREKISWKKIRIGIGIITCCMVISSLLCNLPNHNKFAISAEKYTWDSNWTLIDIENQTEEILNLPITFDSYYGDAII